MTVYERISKEKYQKIEFILIKKIQGGGFANIT